MVDLARLGGANAEYAVLAAWADVEWVHVPDEHEPLKDSLFAIGEGLVGQAAVEGKVITIDDVATTGGGRRVADHVDLARGAVAQPRESPAGVPVPFDPAAEPSLATITPARAKGTDIAISGADRSPATEAVFTM
mgnify:CR=1 FL=1